ncbi:hypothetical protein FRC07_015045 [Ceratobasidium sp. 392]|nr:hypothetical protein FRC07_015045 [Ceratobasidium sp. 392]
MSWRSWFERRGDLADIDKAIKCQLRAVELTPNGHPDKPGGLSNLGNSWQSRFQRLGNLADLDEAIKCTSRAVELTPDGPAKSGHLSNLGSSWKSRFKRLGDLTDLDKAIECVLQAVELIPDGHPHKPACMGTLANSWLTRFARLGNLMDIDKAVECASRAVKLTPDGHPAKPTYLSSLGNSWRYRFERLKNLTDIDKAIECISQAVELTPDSYSTKRDYLIDLGVSLKSRFGHLGNLVDINKAIECVSRAVELTSDDNPVKPNCLHSLGTSLGNRFEQTGNLADIDKAIECQSRAVELTADGHPDKPGRLNNLGNFWQARFQQYGDLADSDKAIECISRAIELIPNGHANRSRALGALGNSWQRRFERHGRTEDLEASVRYFQKAAELDPPIPAFQSDCTRIWAELSLFLGHSPLKAYMRAFSLLPQRVSLGQTIQERYNALLSVSDLAAEAAAWAVSVGLYDLALEWLEQGRSVVWSQTLQLRTPFDELARVDSGLADRLRGTASRLDAASSRSQVTNISLEPLQDLESQAQEHRRLAKQWDELLTEARQLPGFEGFMLPRTSADLKRAATDGPVVVINTHSTRCDALVIFPECDDIAHIPLDSLTNEQLKETCSQVISLVGHRGNSARSIKYLAPLVESQDHLQPYKDLWSSVVGPVLNALACTSQLPYDELPHVTWCATGALSFLPLHAAGLHDGQSFNAFDFVISSYTPTLSALLPRSDQTIERAHGVLAVGQENAQGQPPLPMTVKELTIVKKHTKATIYHQLDGASATVEATLDALEKYSWVHLACHGVQNRDKPSHSAFYLHDGSLTLEEIAKRQFKNKGLAFLSACQTATGDEGLPDEATHLAAGMLTAGYPSVIATMWSIMDDDAPEVAEEVYAELMKDGMMDHRRTAIALHKAVGKLREKVGLESIDRWAPFIHVGV